MCVLHRCDTPTCVNPDHLFLGTRTDNNADKEQKGRTRGKWGIHKPVAGTAHPRAKLTEAQVLAIRADTRLRREIAKEYNIIVSHVDSIRHRQSWKHI
jgi:hypothetical protein